jgi:PD-(D/E)XK nuclease superfamily
VHTPTLPAWKSRKPFGNDHPTWSMSRDQQLHACERKFFFQYLSPARINDPEPEQRTIALLKKLKTIQMWQGECFHWAVARYLDMLRDGKMIFTDQLLASLKERMQREWEFSEQRRFRQQPMLIGRQGVALFEHEYDVASNETLETASAATTKLLARFFTWMSGRTELKPPAFGVDAPGINVGGVQVLTKVDLALQISGESFEIYDWKTGKAPPYRPIRISHNDLQVMVYQLWPHIRLHVPLEHISSNLVYFGGPVAEQQKFSIDEDSLASTMLMVRNSIELAQRWQKNISTGEMVLADLDYAAFANVCRQCPFKRLCYESLK